MYYLKVKASADAAAYLCVVLSLNEKQIVLHQKLWSDEASHESENMYNPKTPPMPLRSTLSRANPLVISVFGKASIYMEAVCATCGVPYAT